MIHLALSIAAFLFLTLLCLIVGTVAVLGVRDAIFANSKSIAGFFLFAAFVVACISGGSHSESTPAGSAASMSEDKTSPNPITLVNRINEGKTYLLPVQDGEAWLLAAFPTRSNQLRVIVRFHSSDATISLVRRDPQRGLALLRTAMCGEAGILATYRMSPSSLSFVIYEENIRLGELPLPDSYCDPELTREPRASGN